MTEKEYRECSFTDNTKTMKNKRIAVYGLGINANYIIKHCTDYNIIALMDQKHEGEYFYGKKVITMQEAIELGVEIILIAASIDATQIVFKRIRNFCISNQIMIIDMYGFNLLKLYYNILEQEVLYNNCKEDSVKEHISQYDVICVQLIDVLCAYGYYDKNSFYHILEKKWKEKGKFKVENYAYNRNLAEEKFQKSQIYDLKKVYNLFSNVSSLEENEKEELCNFEENEIVGGILPRRNIVKIINWAVEQGRDVYIISDLHVSEKCVKVILNKIGLTRYSGVIQENLINVSLKRGAFLEILKLYQSQKILYIGTKSNLIIPQLYKMDILMLKSAWELYEQCSLEKVKKDSLSNNEKRDVLSKRIQEICNSPFICDVKETMEEENRIITIESEKKKYDYCPVIFPLYDDEGLTKKEKLYFVEYNTPVVSIIVHTYNQFSHFYNCLKAILQYSENISYEVIVINEYSQDEVNQIEETIEGIRICNSYNSAIKDARGENILFLKSDTQVQPGWLYHLVKMMQDEEVGMTGSKLISPEGILLQAGGIVWKNGMSQNYGYGQNSDLAEYNYVREVDYISSAAIIIKKELLTNIGGFNESYVSLDCRDMDLAFEVRKRAKKVLYQPSSIVVSFTNIFKEENEADLKKFKNKWNNILEFENYVKDTHILAASEKKRARKTVLFISVILPKYDCDAGSKTLYYYIKIFIKKGYIVKFIPANYMEIEPYATELQQMGVQILVGDYYKNNIEKWILQNQEDINFAFLNYPRCSYSFIDILKQTSIKILYYGMDLHYIRLHRQYDLNGNKNLLKEADEIYDIEKQIIQKADVVYYPSVVETEIVKKEFGKEESKLLAVYLYDLNKKLLDYKPKQREGIMFVGGFGHLPNVDAMVWFVKDIYPLIKEKKDIPFYIVGSNEPLEVQRLTGEGIIHKGYVTEQELLELYGRVKMVVVPLRFGAGVKGKVVEAMYNGIPIVTTSVGAEGIPEVENCVSIADEAVSFAQKVIELYNDEDKLLSYSFAGREEIKKYYSEDVAWNLIKEDFS